MAVETIEGALVAAQPSRRKWGYGYYKELSFTMPGGLLNDSVRTITRSRCSRPSLSCFPGWSGTWTSRLPIPR